jgi:hypothetical protein
MDCDQERKRMGKAGEPGVIEELPQRRVIGIRDAFR